MHPAMSLNRHSPPFTSNGASVGHGLNGRGDGSFGNEVGNGDLKRLELFLADTERAVCLGEKLGDRCGMNKSPQLLQESANIRSNQATG